MSVVNPASAIYRSEYYYVVRGIMCRNSFHHYTEVPAGRAEFINQQVLSKMIVPILELQSAYITPIQLTTTLVTGNFQDSYAYFMQTESGLIAATAEDPRLGVYVKIETSAGARDHFTGGCNIAGIPQNWTQNAPVLEDAGRTAFRNKFDFMVTQIGAGNNASPIKWVVFSRTLFEANPNDPGFWSERVSHIGVRRYLLSLRTRRPRPDF
jgi:hypothetical protein